MKRSIRVRLMVWVLAVLVPLSIIAAWLLVQVFRDRLVRDIDVALQEEAETVGELAATPAGAGAVAGLVARIAEETDVGPRKYVLVTRHGQVIAEAPHGAQAVLRSGDPGLRIVHYESRDPGAPIVVSMAVSAAATLHAKQRLTSLLAVGLPLIVVLFSAGLWLVIERALRPLENASRRLDQIGADGLSVRVPIENPDDEVGRMVTVLNRMLDRLECAVAELQRFTADAAHELRTPLTVLHAGLEVALARERSAAEYRGALTEALAATNRMCRLAEDLLTLARLDAAAAPRAAAPVDLGEMLRELADALEETAAAHRLALEVAAPPELSVAGNSGDLYRLFSNLIENALRYGGNGGGATGAVQVHASRTPDGIEVRIADRGPGIAPDQLPRVFDRFYRGRGERVDRGGTGLGLSIALEIARTHGGRIAATNRDGGGCVVTVTLPAAATPLTQ